MVKTLALLLGSSLASLMGDMEETYITPNIAITSVSLVDRSHDQVTAEITVLSATGSKEVSPTLSYTLDGKTYETIVPNLKGGEERRITVTGQINAQDHHVFEAKINSDHVIDELFFLDNESTISFNTRGIK
ncbi:hypothetical protein HP567_029745 (plasmid) [Brevibacillus sp. M2.1A]|uniref:hypothetical protein n=1 Tax=Brevibacillus sp. M2.1A TaxID=2738980 RepID=UPI00156B16A2|nr:hypothetical protein [Brevibacillus sp. M2.1A]MCC8438720.1 hypothetical protein [Brevibacillus sp. M2.1A]